MLKNKVALVTGASSGIGRAIALVWAREGARVVVSDVNVQAGEETAALVRAAGGDAIFVAADVGKPGDCEALVSRTVAHYGRLDIACNNAGIGGPQAPTADYPLDGWAQVINTNLSGVFYGMKYQIAAMLKDSFATAQQDMQARALVEARVDADRMIAATHSALAADADLLEPAELESIHHLIAQLGQITSGDNTAAIESATEALAKGTEAFAAMRMNRGIQHALAGKRLEEV